MSRMSSQLLDQARYLAERDERRPRQANLRRSISTAYYAVFHLLIDAACHEFTLASSDARPLREAIARAFDHGAMKSACRAFASSQLPAVLLPALGGRPVSGDLKVIADRFVQLQQERHAADYDPARVYLRHDAVELVDIAADAHDVLWPRVSGTRETGVFLWSLLLQRVLVRR